MKTYITTHIAELKSKMSDVELELSGYFIDNSSSMDTFGELIDQYVDGEVDVYNSSLMKWLNNTINSKGYMEQAIEEGLVTTNSYDFFEHVRCAQFLQKTEEYHSEFSDNCIELFVLDYLQKKGIEDEESYNKVSHLFDTGMCDTPDDLVDSIKEALSEDED